MRGWQDHLYGITLTAIALGWLLYGLLFFRKLRSHKPISPDKVRYPHSLFGMGLQGGAVTVIGFWRRPFGSPLFPMGYWLELGLALVTLLVLASSLLLTRNALQMLGKEWSLTARLVEDHQLVTRGAYSLVRHPIYTGLFGMMLASGLAWGHWGALAVATVVFSAGTLIRIGSEERLLRSEFGAEYDAYRRRVPAFLPFLL